TKLWCVSAENERPEFSQTSILLGLGVRVHFLPLRHTVQRRRIIERLQNELGNSADLDSVFDRAAATIRRAEDAFLLDDVPSTIFSRD
ncbi:MAG: hypothetical protein ABGX07_09290, partial [Pirellulaceae bacterium]